MLWYSFLEKRGDCIKKRVNWYLYEQENLLVENLNVECDVNSNEIMYKEDNYVNNIDLQKKIFIREDSNFKMILDYDKQEFIYTLKEINKTFTTNIKIDFDIKENEICISYILEDSKLKILIHML